MLIIEGSDCVGKSVFVEACYRRLHDRGHEVTHHHLSRPPAGVENDWVGYYSRMIRPWAIFDRFHLGEIVYPRVRGDACTIDETTLREVERRLADASAVIVVLGCRTQALADRVGLLRRQGREEMYTDQQIVKANSLFSAMTSDWEVFDKYDVPKAAYDIKWWADQRASFPAADERLVASVCDLYEQRQVTREPSAFQVAGRT